MGSIHPHLRVTPNKLTLPQVCLFGFMILLLTYFEILVGVKGIWGRGRQRGVKMRFVLPREVPDPLLYTQNLKLAAF